MPQGYYNLAQMISIVTRRTGQAGVCGTCMDARRTTDAELTDGAHRWTLNELAAWMVEADQVLVF